LSEKKKSKGKTAMSVKRQNLMKLGPGQRGGTEEGEKGSWEREPQKGNDLLQSNTKCASGSKGVENWGEAKALALGKRLLREA